jgi:gamma-glutamyl-gamma-aminobutyraldehyde dehydrogenase
VVLADAPDLDRAAQFAAEAIFHGAGEVCNAGSRLLVQESLAETFIERFQKQAAASFRPGDPLDPATTMGPLVTQEQQKRVLGYIDSGKADGAKLAMGGTIPTGFQQGNYVSPTLFTAVKSSMKIAQEEIFGPVAAVIPFKDVAEATRIANDSIYGLAASIWTSDLTTAHRMARDVEAGVVWINCFDHGDMTQPFGGYKQSGQGRDKCFETVLAHTQTKSIWINLG